MQHHICQMFFGPAFFGTLGIADQQLGVGCALLLCLLKLSCSGSGIKTLIWMTWPVSFTVLGKKTSLCLFVCSCWYALTWLRLVRHWVGCRALNRSKVRWPSLLLSGGWWHDRSFFLFGEVDSPDLWGFEKLMIVCCLYSPFCSLFL